ELAQELVRDRGTFALAHNQLIYQIQEIAERLEKAKSDLVRIQKQAEDQRQLVNKRKKDVEQAQAELEQARKATAARIKELDEMRKSLMNIRVEVRDA